MSIGYSIIRLLSYRRRPSQPSRAGERKSSAMTCFTFNTLPLGIFLCTTKAQRGVLVKWHGTAAALGQTRNERSTIFQLHTRPAAPIQRDGSGYGKGRKEGKERGLAHQSRNDYIPLTKSQTTRSLSGEGTYLPLKPIYLDY